MEFEEIVALLVLMLEEEYASMDRLELIQKMAESYLKQFDWKDEEKAKSFLQALQAYKLKKAPQLEGVLVKGQSSSKVEAEDEEFLSCLNFSELDSMINDAVTSKSGLNPEVIGFASTLIEECKKYMFDEEVPRIMITSECTGLLWEGENAHVSVVISEEGIDITTIHQDADMDDDYVYPLDNEFIEDIIQIVQDVLCGEGQ